MLQQICMDQLYVAYFPNDEKYLALFSNRVRIEDDEKTEKKRELIRNRTNGCMKHLVRDSNEKIDSSSAVSSIEDEDETKAATASPVKKDADDGKMPMMERCR